MNTKTTHRPSLFNCWRPISKLFSVSPTYTARTDAQHRATTSCNQPRATVSNHQWPAPPATPTILAPPLAPPPANPAPQPPAPAPNPAPITPAQLPPDAPDAAHPKAQSCASATAARPDATRPGAANPSATAAGSNTLPDPRLGLVSSACGSVPGAKRTGQPQGLCLHNHLL
jgi:hypothetical protein